MSVARVIGCLGLLLGSACLQPSTPEDACASACDCLFFGPVERQQCRDECVVDIDGAATECLDCLAVSSCSELEDSEYCAAECGIATTMENAQ